MSDDKVKKRIFVLIRELFKDETFYSVIEAVSYTHLDVYKRQVKKLPERTIERDVPHYASHVERHVRITAEGIAETRVEERSQKYQNVA